MQHMCFHREQRQSCSGPALKKQARSLCIVLVPGSNRQHTQFTMNTITLCQSITRMIQNLQISITTCIAQGQHFTKLSTAEIQLAMSLHHLHVPQANMLVADSKPLTQPHSSSEQPDKKISTRWVRTIKWNWQVTLCGLIGGIGRAHV